MGKYIWNIIYANGAASRTLSKRSRIPPCPGNILPKSFTEHSRFTSDAKKMIARGGTACTVLNSANEAAVGLFLEDKIPFYRIGELVADACENVREHKEVTLGNILDSENTAREYVIAHA